MLKFIKNREMVLLFMISVFGIFALISWFLPFLSLTYSTGMTITPDSIKGIDMVFGQEVIQRYSYQGAEPIIRNAFCPSVLIAFIAFCLSFILVAVTIVFKHKENCKYTWRILLLISNLLMTLCVVLVFLSPTLFEKSTGLVGLTGSGYVFTACLCILNSVLTILLYI